MLLIARILILFFITMAVIRCPGCKKTFETNGGLSSHRQFCKTQINAFAKQILDRHHAVEEPHTKRPRFGKNRVVIGKGKEREEEPETTAVNESDTVRDMDVESKVGVPPQPPPIASAEQAQTFDRANSDDNDIQLSENHPDLLLFMTDSNSYGIY
jgi:hypothetical protein